MKPLTVADLDGFLLDLEPAWDDDEPPRLGPQAFRGEVRVLGEGLPGTTPRRPRGRPPNPTPRRGGVRITPQDRANVHAALVHLAEDASAGNADAAAQLRSVRRLLLSWENRQKGRRK